MIKIQEENALRPSLALVFYSMDDRSREAYAELHKIDDLGQIGAGQPLSQKAFDRLFDLTAARQREIKKNKSACFTFDPARTILKLNYHIDSIKSLIWRIDGGTRQHFFSKELGIPDGVAPHPPLIFAFDRATNNVSVFSYKDDILQPHTKLYIPAYFNLSASGLICLGSARLKYSSDINEQMAHIEAAFFNSYFSHAGDLASKVKFNMISFWKSLMGSDKPFPASGLVKYRSTTLKEIL